MRFFVEVSMTLRFVQSGKPDDVRVVPVKRRSGRIGAAVSGLCQQQADAGGGAIRGIALDAQRVKDVSEGGAQVEAVEDLGGIPIGRETVGEGAQKTPGDNGRPHGDGGGLWTVTGEDDARIGRPAVGKGMLERGKFAGCEQQIAITGSGRRCFRSGDVEACWPACGRSVRFSFGGAGLAVLIFWLVALRVCGRTYLAQRLKGCPEKVVRSFLQCGESFFVTAGGLAGMGMRRLRVGGGGFDQIGEAAQHIGMESGAESVVYGAQFEVSQRIVEAPDAGAVQVGTELVPGVFGGDVHLSPVLKQVVLIRAEVETEAAFANFAELA